MSMPEVIPVSEARAGLSRTLATFREQGAAARPVFVGAHRRAEGVLLPMALFNELAPLLEDVLIAKVVRDRLRQDTGERVSHEDLLAELAVEP